VTPSATLVEPSFRSGPAFTRTLGPEVAELAALAGFAPDPEQRLGLDLAFAMDAAGRSVAFEVAVICSRQNLKTGFFKQCALGWLHLTDQRLVVWSAHEFRTAQEAFRDMDELHAAHPSLAVRVKRVYRGNGDEAIELKSGQRLIFKARTGTGGRGLSGDKVVLDEAFALQPAHMGALMPTLSVRPDPQLFYGSSAGMADSAVLRGIRDRGRAGSSPRLAYLEWGAPRGGCVDPNCGHGVGVGGCALDDEGNWARANPLLGRTRANGTGLTAAYVRDEREALPPAEFARERLGWWDEPAGSAAAFGEGKWESCVGDPAPEGTSLGALAVAVSYDQTWAAIAGAAVVDGVVYLKPLDHRPGTGWLVERAVELQDKHRVPVVIDGKGPAAELVGAFEAVKADLVVAETADVLDACAGLFTAVQERRVRHQAFGELDAAAAAAVKRTVGDRWAWGRKATGSDISVLETVTLAAWGARRPVKASTPWFAFD